MRDPIEALEAQLEASESRQLVTLSLLKEALSSMQYANNDPNGNLRLRIADHMKECSE